MIYILKENILSRFKIPTIIINYGDKHFSKRLIEYLMKKNEIICKVNITYHHQTSGLIGLANKEIKQILRKMVNLNYKD